jgi:hypothetical protein
MTDVKIELVERDWAALRKSVEFERESDLCAAAGNIGDATMLMKEANRLRESVFGKFDPNELRERTHAALSAQEASR